jgi:hypothetical protein
MGVELELRVQPRGPRLAGALVMLTDDAVSTVSKAETGLTCVPRSEPVSLSG